LYDTNGNVVVDEKAIIDNSHSQTEPWVVFNPEVEQYLFVYEDASNPAQGPFSIKTQLCDKNLNTIGSEVTIATGTTNTDYTFPCVAYCEETDSYLVTYNDGDISDGDWQGNVWGAILDNSGQLDVGPFQIKSGEYIRTDIVPYLGASFLVSYDNGAKVYGKLVASDGSALSNEIQLSCGERQNLCYLGR